MPAGHFTWHRFRLILLVIRILNQPVLLKGPADNY
jgi:hypothetical protein